MVFRARTDVGWHRYRQLGVTLAPYGDTVDRPLRPTDERAVFARDHFHCRYCGTRTVAKPVLKALERAVGTSEFCASRNDNTTDHGIVLAFKVVADHVVPRNLGGRTDLDNLVTSCPSCNYGKASYTLEQLGLDHPCDRPPMKGDWDGLTSLVADLNANQTTS